MLSVRLLSQVSRQKLGEEDGMLMLCHLRTTGKKEYIDVLEKKL